MLNLNNPNKKSTLYLHKIKVSENQKILNELKKHFESVEHYLDLSNKIVINKKKIFSSISASLDEPNLKHQRGIRKLTMKPKLSKTRREDSSFSLKTPSQIESIDKFQVKNLFEKLKSIEKSNNTKTSINKTLFNLPLNIKHKLNLQQQTLLAKQKEENDNKLLSNFLCKKAKKKFNQLLIHDTENYRLKCEMMNKIGNIYKGNKCYWVESLRSPGNFSTNCKLIGKYGYNNVWSFRSKDNNNLEGNENLMEDREDEVNQSNKKMKYKIFLRMKSTPNYKKLNTNYSEKKIEIMDSMTLKGKNLLSIEYNNAISLKGKLIYKRKNKDKCDSLRSLRKTFYSNYRSQSN